MTEAATKAWLAGAINPLRCGSSLLVPVFSECAGGNDYLLQELDHYGRVLRFLTVPSDDVDRLFRNDEVTVSVGSEGMWGLQFPAGDSIIDTRRRLGDHLEARREEFRDHRLTYLTAARVLCERAAVHRATRDAWTRVSALHPRAADVWRSTVGLPSLVRDAVESEFRARGVTLSRRDLEGIELDVTTSPPQLRIPTAAYDWLRDTNRLAAIRREVAAAAASVDMMLPAVLSHRPQRARTQEAAGLRISSMGGRAPSACIHFTGIAGAGMAAVALMMREAGHAITGSDQDIFPPMSDYVESLGFPVAWRFDPANLPEGLDLLVLGASAKLGGEGNVEVQEARRRGVRITTFPELIGEATALRHNTVVAGSFGKSTCTALLSHVLRVCGVDAGWMIGAISPSLPNTGHWGTAPEVVLEGDEYIIGPTDRRSKFVLYHPRDVLLTSLIHDHVNVFPTFEDYVRPFGELMRLLPAEGLLVAREHPAIRAIAGEAASRIVWYDTQACDGWYPEGVVYGETTRFTLVGPGGRRVALATSLLGEHNVENIVGVSAYLLERGLVGEAELARAVESFGGIRRRLDRLTDTSAVPVIEGFGSSYEKARSAIEAMLLHYPTRPLTVVFEPHTFSWRNRDALPWYDTVFEGVAQVLVVPPPSHGADSHLQATLGQILDRITTAGVSAEAILTEEEGIEALTRLSGNDVVLLLSSGPLLGLPESLPRAMEARFGRATRKTAS